MKNRRNIFAIVRWTHTERQFDLSWPVLHFFSYLGRGVLLGIVVLWLFVVLIVAYLEESSFAEAAELINSIAPPWIIVILVSISVVVLILDFVLRKHLRIDSKTITLRQPWAITRSWPRSSLTDVNIEVETVRSWDDFDTFVWLDELSYVQMVLRNNASKEQVAIGGMMSARVAEDLANQIKKYIRAPISRGLRHRSAKTS